MSIVKFEQHLRDPAPAFRCYDCNDRKCKLTLIARVKNQIARPASSQALAILEDRLGKAVHHLRGFYELHDGVILYRDTRSRAAGIRFYRTRDWERRSSEMRDWMIEMDMYQEMPDWFRRGVAFAEIPASANYFVIGTEGRSTGQIFYADHDDFHREPIAKNLDSFLAMIIRNPAKFLYERGCHTRFSDGKTDKQWIAKEYVADSGS